MNRKSIIEKYFSSWINKDRKHFEEIFSEVITYSECYGPKYHGLEQISRWFDDWNKCGTVLIWDIKNVYQDNDVYVVEWYFECDYNNNIDGFNGVSLIEFNKEEKIMSIKEFQSKAKHHFPYEHL